jgi:hypothetical protein
MMLKNKINFILVSVVVMVILAIAFEKTKTHFDLKKEIEFNEREQLQDKTKQDFFDKVVNSDDLVTTQKLYSILYLSHSKQEAFFGDSNKNQSQYLAAILNSCQDSPATSLSLHRQIRPEKISQLDFMPWFLEARLLEAITDVQSKTFDSSRASRVFNDILTRWPTTRNCFFAVTKIKLDKQHVLKIKAEAQKILSTNSADYKSLLPLFLSRESL